MIPNTNAPDADAPDYSKDYFADAPDTDYNASAYPKQIQINLRNINRNHKIPPNTKNNKNNAIPNTDVPDAGVPDASDAPNDDDDDADYPYSLRNFKNKKKNMTPNTDYPNDDSPDAADNDAASPNSIILDSYLERKIEPKSILKLFFK